jgi:D-alanyl-D-alanine carboxypeptidase/D-alanyl-D-alanine-endopeptidase (penicillin-binding protein 4)
MRLRRLRVLAAGAALGAGLVTTGAGSAGSPPPPDRQLRIAAGLAAPTVAPSVAPQSPQRPAGWQPAIDPTPSWILDPALRLRVEQVLARPDLALPGPVAVSVANPDGIELVSSAGDLPVLPASTEKLLTAAAALNALDPDFRYRTDLLATAAPAPDGVLAGDLVLVGSGDPALTTPLYAARVDPQRPRTPLDVLADQAVAAGLRHVTGSVLGDPSVFPDEPAAPGWQDAYFRTGDATRVSGLTVDTGRIVAVTPGGVTAAAADDPAAQAAAALYGQLRERGVTFGGTAGSVRVPPEAPVPIGAVDSPALTDLLRHTVQRSDNHMADALFRSVGVAAGDGTWAGSARAVVAALEPLDLDLQAVSPADGSGLSRSNRVPTDLLTALQAAMTRSDLGPQWQGLMAVSGESGTLRERLRGTPAEHRFRGKTGSLRDVRALAGSVVGPAGEHYHVAVVANDLAVPGLPVARALQDAVVVAVAEVLYGCPPTAADPPAAPATCVP